MRKTAAGKCAVRVIGATRRGAPPSLAPGYVPSRMGIHRAAAGVRLVVVVLGRGAWRGAVRMRNLQVPGSETSPTTEALIALGTGPGLGHGQVPRKRAGPWPPHSGSGGWQHGKLAAVVFEGKVCK